MSTMDEKTKDIVLGMGNNIECLTAPDRNKRKNALKNITKTVEKLIGRAEDSKEGMGVLEGVFEAVAAPLAKSMGEEIEKNRWMAVELVQAVLEALADKKGYLGVFIDQIHARVVANQSKKEPAEELRFELLSVLRTLLTAEGVEVTQHAGKVVDVLVAGLGDSFPDAKSEAAKCVMQLAASVSEEKCELTPEKRTQHFSTLAKTLERNLKHQHSAVRLVSFMALSTMMKNSPGGKLPEWMREKVAAVRALLHDRTPKVRDGVVRESVSWFTALPNLSASDKSLLLMVVLSAAGDENPDIRRRAVAALQTIADCMPEREQEAAEEGKEEAHTEIAEELPAQPWPQDAKVTTPFEQSPSDEMRALIVGLLDQLIPAATAELADWTVRTRFRAAALLHAIVICAQQAVGEHLIKILQYITRTTRDEDDTVRGKVHQLTRTIGWFLSPEAYFSVILPGLASTSDANYRCSSLSVLGNLLQGASNADMEAFRPSIPSLVECLLDPELSFTEDAQVRFYLMDVMQTLVGRFPTLCGSSDQVEQFARIALRMDATASSAHEQAETMKLLVLLARAERASSSSDSSSSSSASVDDSKEEGDSSRLMTEFYEAHFLSLFRSLVGAEVALEGLDWGEHSILRCVLYQLLVRSGAIVLDYLSEVLPVLVCCAHPDRHAQTRSATFSLLLTLFTTLDEHVEEAFLQEIVEKIVATNLAWKAGHIAEAIRGQAIALLELLCAKEKVTKKIMLQVTLLPVLKSNLDDEQRDIRLAVSHVYQHLLGTCREELKIDDLALTDLYRDFLKRLDDSDDAIRIDMAKTFLVLFHSLVITRAQREFDHAGVHYGYIIKTFCVHLDDSNEDIRDAAFGFLSDALVIRYNTPLYFQEVRAAREKHTSAFRCDQLLHIADKVASNEDSSVDKFLQANS